MIAPSTGMPNEPQEMSPLLEIILQGINQQPRMSAYDIPSRANVTRLPGVRKPSPGHVEEAKKQVIDNLKRAAELVQQKVEGWHLFEDMYYNRRQLNQFAMTRQEAKWYTQKQQNAILKPAQGEYPDWRCHQVIATSPIVDSRVQAATRSIFTSPEYYHITPDSKDGNTVEDPAYPTSRKLQTLFLRSCSDLHFKTRVHEALRDAFVFGTCVAKVTWYEEKDTERGMDDQGNEFDIPTMVSFGAPLHLVNLARFLPDPQAKHSNVQLWEFVGDRTPVPYDIVKSRFGTTRKPGPYNINKDEFLEKWPDGGQPLSHMDIAPIKDDPDSDTMTSTPVTYLQVWEYHGRLYFPGKDGPTECVATVITDLGTDDPSGGILVRLQEKPALKLGARPYLVYHATPQAAPFGMGIIEQNIDLIWLLSHSINLFIDAVRILSVPMYLYRQGRPFAAEHTGPRMDLIYPGKGIPFASDPNEVQPFSFHVADLPSLVQLIQYLEKMLEARTSVSDATRGLSTNRKTASEFVGLVQQSQQPLESSLILFKEAFLDPYGKLAMIHFQSRISEDQMVWMSGGVGANPIPVELTLEEIQSGTYRVEAVLDAPEQQKMARAMAGIQLLPVLEQQAGPLLLMENTYYKRAPLIEAITRMVGINDYAPVLEKVDEQTKQMLLAMIQGGGRPPQGGQPGGIPASGGPPEAPGGPPPIGVPNSQPAPNSGTSTPEGLPPNLQAIIAMIQANAQGQGAVPNGMQMGAM